MAKYTKLESIPPDVPLLQALLNLPSHDLIDLLSQLERKRMGILRRASVLAAPGVSPRLPPFGALNGLDSPVALVAAKGSSRDLTLVAAKGSSRDLRLQTAVASPRDSSSVPSSERAAPQAVDPGAPVVQFTTFLFYASEDEGVMKVDVMRAGDLSKPSEVNFRTRNLTAKAGVKYVKTEVRICFEANQDMFQVDVPLINDDKFDTTQEFGIELDGGEAGIVNAALGKYLWRARVKIIDDDCFPSNAVEEYVRGGENVSAAPQFTLFMEYVKFNWSDANVRERSIKCMMADQMHNIYGFFHLFVNVYLVDSVLRPSANLDDLFFVHSKMLSLLLIVGTVLVPFFLLHLLDMRKAEKWGVGGASRQRLQSALLTKFLNYNSASRAKIRSGDLTMAMTRDSIMVVAHGYWHVLAIVKDLGDLFLMLAYQFIAPVVFHKKFIPLAIMPFIFFPIAMAIFLKFRTATTSQLLSKRNTCQNLLVAGVEEAVGNYRVIAGYNQRTKCVDRFEAWIKDFNGANRASGCYLKNNAYYARYVSHICIAAWTVLGGSLVLAGDLSLGMFLANVHIIARIGGAWGGIYKTSLEIMTIFPALANIVVAINLPTDLPVRQALNRKRRRDSIEERARLKREGEGDDGAGARSGGRARLPLDRMELVISNVRFTHCGVGPGGDKRLTEINHMGTAKLSQGELTVLLGRSGGGKSTLLRILGGEILPTLTDGDGKDAASRLFIPSHLRVLHVVEPLFFVDNLLVNLTMGVDDKDDPEADPDRVMRVCERLGADPEILGLVKTGVKLRWPDVLSKSQCQLLSLARALVMNPEVLCIHQPTQVFEEDIARHIMSVLREYIDNPGVETPHIGPGHHRRPRTLIMTTTRRSAVSHADRIFNVDRKGVEEVTLAEAMANIANMTAG